MYAKLSNETQAMMIERFGKDTLIAMATLDGEMPAVRAVNAYYEEGSFYVVTHALSAKMRQIAVNPNVAICGDWFTAHGVGKNLGYILASENAVLAAKLRKAFASWFDNGHVDESDPNTCILRIRLTDGILMAQGTRHEIDFT